MQEIFKKVWQNDSFIQKGKYTLKIQNIFG